ncbi:MAG TPA: protein phosphatase 2C domain-containing protein, partial [Mycobacterium sp.]
MRGHLHRYNGAPRQDDYAVAVTSAPDRLIVAVADGVSGAPQSHIGATTAVRYASQWLGSMGSAAAADIDWEVLIKSTAWSLIEQAAAMTSGETDAGQAEADLATTL